MQSQLPLKQRFANSRHLFLQFLLSAAVIALIIEIMWLLPSTIARWNPFDYGLYIEMGNALRRGVNPYGLHHYWPLPTMLWIFVPLSLMPDWFRLVWILGPIISILVLFRYQGILLALFTPLWFVVSDGMLDGWLLIPLAWLLENRPIWAGVGAALVLFKPQLAILAVAYSVFKWLMASDWKNLGIFGCLIALFYLPSFLLRPNWPFEMLSVLPSRAAQTTTIFPLMSSSNWAWWFLGGLGIVVFPMMLLATIVLFGRAVQVEQNRAAGFLLLNLLINPWLFASNLIMSVPVLRARNEIIMVGVISLAAFALDHVLAGFGGGYAFIPLAAMYFQTKTRAETYSSSRS